MDVFQGPLEDPVIGAPIATYRYLCKGKECRAVLSRFPDGSVALLQHDIQEGFSYLYRPTGALVVGVIGDERPRWLRDSLGTALYPETYLDKVPVIDLEEGLVLTVSV